MPGSIHWRADNRAVTAAWGEPQLPDLAAQVAGVGLAEIFGALAESADQKVHRPKSRSPSWASQDRTSGSISTSYSRGVGVGDGRNGRAARPA
jgi:hypothetical protein